MSDFDIREECPHCDEAQLAHELDAHVARTHRDLPPCTARIETEHRETFRCAFRAGHDKGEYGEWHASKRDGVGSRHRWNDTTTGAVPHQPSEPTTRLDKLKAMGALSHTVVATGGAFPERPIRATCAVLHTDEQGNVIPCPDETPKPPASRTASLSAYSGLVVQPYRNDQGRPCWVFRCWGTDDGCDGWLSLDHTSAQSGARDLTGHVEEHHAPGVPQPEVQIRIREGLTEQQRAEVRRIVEDSMRRAGREGQARR